MDIVKAVVDAQYKSTLRWAAETHEASDQVFVEYNGAPTSRVAKVLDCDLSTAKKVRNSACRRGLLVKSRNNKGSKECRWWPAGYLAQVKRSVA